MAQAHLNDYFSAKKRTDITQAAKRRKIEIPFSGTEHKISNRTRSKSDDGKKSPATNPLISPELDEHDGCPLVPPLFSVTKGASAFDNILFKSAASLTSSGRTKNGKRSKFPVSSASKGKIHTLESGQKKLTDLFIKSSSNLPSYLNCDVGPESQTPGSTSESKSKDSTNIEKQTIIVEEVTSFWDNHSSDEQSTPRKRIINIEDVSSEVPHSSRRRKVPVRKQSPDKQQNLEMAKKKLVLIDPSQDAGPSKAEDNTPDDTDDEVSSVMTDKSHLLALMAEIITPLESAVSPLAVTPERQEEVSSSPEPVVPATPKLQNLSQKLKALSKMNGQALKNRLKQSGKIYDITEKFKELDKAIREEKSQTVTIVTSAAEDIGVERSEKVLPAHQRFEHLAQEGLPTLVLPYSYKLLEGAFQAMDTVVSMMHNRSEMCTFSKLRAAVQNMTKKDFEEQTVGQIKTIVPEAYIFRQESNISTFGKKAPGHQLTVEANLAEDKRPNEVEGPHTSEGKPIFTASALLKRKHRFKYSLLSYLKQLHKNFLASLKCPMSVPDDKLTRWHPRFQLDKVPDVVAAALPQPPEVKVYHSAKDVLEKQRGRLNPRVEEALSRVAAEQSVGNSSQETLISSLSSASSSLSISEQSSPSMKGIPPALLAKIRAKEAQKMEEALTRSPLEDSKTKMMSHLPEFIRILRTYFVTEKKPAIPLEAIYKVLQSSYRAGITQREIEQHVDMLKELAPELVSVVEVKRGKFLKLDKNVDVQAVSNRILNLVKSRK